MAVQRRWGLDERLMAFLDDIYVSCNPDRVVSIFNLLRHELRTLSRIQIHVEKTQIWNRGGVEPPGCTWCGHVWVAVVPRCSTRDRHHNGVSSGTGPLTRSAPMWVVPRRWPPDVANNVDIQSWQGRTAVHGSWSWLARSVGGGLTRPGTSPASCPERRPARSLR